MKLNALVTVCALLGAVLTGAARGQAPVGQGLGYYPVAPALAPGYPPPPGAMPYGPGPAGVSQASLSLQAAGCSEQDNCECNTCCNACCGWFHRVAIFGELLYLQARDSEVAYGVPIDGPIVPPPTNNPIQIGRVGVVDQDFDPGFRFGATYVLDDFAALSAQYTMFETQRQDTIATTAPDVLRSLVTHPGAPSAGTDFLSAQARHDISFDAFDIDYRALISCSDVHELTLVVGARAVEFEQQFSSTFTATGTETITTDIDFYGAGLRLGLEGERFARRQLFVYGKTAANLLAGEFRADYDMSRSFDATIVDTNWRAGRIMPVLDLEVGAGFESKCGTWRLSAGYSYSAWVNAVKTDDWISAVQRNNFLDLGDTMTFDGLVARVEGRF